MATLVHCDGCGRTESEEAEVKKIQPVSFARPKDPATAWIGNEEYTADLCENCQDKLLHTYFNIPAKDRLEEILEPRSLHAAG
jgi:hypothetical protein